MAVSTRKAMNIIEGGHANGHNGLLGAACDHCSSVALTDRIPCLPNGVCPGGAGGDRCPDRSFGASQNRDNARGSVGNGHIDTKRTDMLRTFFVENAELLMHRDYASDATTHTHTHIVGVCLRDLELSMS